MADKGPTLQWRLENAPYLTAQHIPTLTPSRPFRFSTICNEDQAMLAAANGHLWRNQPLAALDVYTENLKTFSPEHPCAYLNRTLCYLALGYPELAVVDAQKTLFAMQAARSKEAEDTLAMSLRQRVESWARWEREANFREHRWIFPSPKEHAVRSQMDDLLTVPMAELRVVSRVDMNKGPTTQRYKECLIYDVTIKAYYRIAYSLWKCGNGAMLSALDVLQDAMQVCGIQESEIKQLNDLGNRILLDIERSYLKESLGVKRCSKSTYPQIYQEGQTRKHLETRYTSIPRRSYPWEKDLTNETQEGAHMLKKLISKAADHSVNSSFNSYSLHVTYTDGQSTYYFCEACGARLSVPDELSYRLMIQAHAETDVPSLSKTTKSPPSSELDVDEYVITPRTPQTQQTSPPIDPLSFSREPLPEVPPTPRPGCTDFRPGVSRRYNSEDPLSSDDGLVFNAQEAELSPMPCETDISVDFRFCLGCRSSTFCSVSCLQSANKTFHARTCETDLAPYIVNNSLSNEHQKAPKQHEEILQKAMLLRILANILTRGDHPLANPILSAIDAELEPAPPLTYNKSGNDKEAAARMKAYDALKAMGKSYDIDMGLLEQEVKREVECPSAKEDDSIPWSYESHVKAPLTFLIDLGGLDTALDVEFFDGWILNTIMVKIKHAMVIHETPVWQKDFNERGELFRTVKIKDLEQETMKEDAEEGETKDENKVWQASLQVPVPVPVPARKDSIFSPSEVVASVEKDLDGDTEMMMD
ncbi:MAG: hypothetical protein M1820_009951 [Bogoriella megaspora]|nr:MAG: hypothetical protein M1820_009951 [Bogoriella megaspora]